MFTTFDKLFLVALQEDNCTVLPSVAKRLKFGLPGAILADLVLLGKVRLVGAHKLELVGADPTGDIVLDKAIDLLHKSEQTRKVSYWLNRLVDDPIVGRKRLFERLVSAGALSQEDEEFTWVIPYDEAVHSGASASYAIKSQLRELVLTHGEPAIEELALLSVIKASRLLNLVFTKSERKAAKEHIYSVLLNRVMKDPVAQTIHEIEVALDILCANG